MGRIRTIKPDFPHIESVGNVSRESRLLFILLWTLVDDSGVTRGNSRMLASLLYPYDVDASGLIDSWLDELADEECITRYAHENQNYLKINNWLSYQKIDRPSQSKHPQPENVREDSRKLALEGKGREWKGKERNVIGMDGMGREVPELKTRKLSPLWVPKDGTLISIKINRLGHIKPEFHERVLDHFAKKFVQVYTGPEVKPRADWDHQFGTFIFNEYENILKFVKSLEHGTSNQGLSPLARANLEHEHATKNTTVDATRDQPGGSPLPECGPDMFPTDTA